MTATMRVLAVIVLYSVSFLSRISSTSIRLVNGPNSSEGRLEVYHDGKWGTVCDDDFDEMDAFVVCRMLSHRVIGLKPSYYGSARYGQGTGPILLDDVNCNGHESDIANCRHRGWGVNDCGHSEDVAVKCSHLPASSIIRLVGGNNPMEGRVQLKILMEWGSICSQGFDNVDAEIICKTLLTSRNASIISDGRYGHGNEGISLSNVACRGNEADLSYCPAKISNSSCPHMQDVAIRCGEDTPIRLVGGKAPFEGRLEVQHNGQWGTVCDDSFSVNDAKVVCRYLGFNFTAPVVYSLAHFGQGNGSILMDDVSCTGNEADLSQCGFPGWGINDCAHTEDVSVRCYAERTPIRLLDGNTLFEGRVEVQHNGQWGTVCDDAFDVNDAKVVCKSLGFNHITPVVYSSAHFGQGSGTIFMDNVNCTGHENDISHCHFLGWGINNCGHGEDVSVKCDVGATPIRLVGGNTPLEGRLEVQHNGHWGTVCDDLFDVNDAMVVCRSLNFYNIWTNTSL